MSKCYKNSYYVYLIKVFVHTTLFFSKLLVGRVLNCSKWCWAGELMKICFCDKATIILVEIWTVGGVLTRAHPPFGPSLIGQCLLLLNLHESDYEDMLFSNSMWDCFACFSESQLYFFYASLNDKVTSIFQKWSESVFSWKNTFFLSWKLVL